VYGRGKEFRGADFLYLNSLTGTGMANFAGIEFGRTGKKAPKGGDKTTSVQKERKTNFEWEREIET